MGSNGQGGKAGIVYIKGIGTWVEQRIMKRWDCQDPGFLTQWGCHPAQPFLIFSPSELSFSPAELQSQMHSSPKRQDETGVSKRQGIWCSFSMFCRTFSKELLKTMSLLHKHVLDLYIFGHDTNRLHLWSWMSLPLSSEDTLHDGTSQNIWLYWN